MAQAFDTSQVPTTLTSSTRRNSSAGTPSSGPSPNPGPLPPATLATRVTVPSSSVARATAASTAASSETSASHRGRPHLELGELGGQRLEVVAAAGAVEGRVGVGPGDVEAGHVRPAPGQGDGGGPADAAGTGRPGHQRDLPSNGRPAGIVCETHRANVATNAGGGASPSAGVSGCGMRAAVTRGGRLVVGEVPDPVPVLGPRRGALALRRHLRVRPARAGRLRATSPGSWTPSACPPWTRRPTASSATSSARRSSSTGPTPPAPSRSGTRVCSVPIIVGPTGVEQIGYSNAYPGALAEHMVLQELLLPPGARRAGHRPGRADRAARRGRARRGAGRPQPRASPASSSAAGRSGWP